MKKYLLPSFLFVLLQTLVAGIGLAQSSITFDASGTWVAPANVTSVTIQMWGAGGGASAGLPNSTSQYAGGGGAFVASKLIAVTPGKSYTVTIATGGTPGNTNAATTYFKDGTLEILYAYGGDNRYGAQGSTGGNVSVTYKGGDGGNSYYNSPTLSKAFGGGGAAGSNGAAGANGGDAVVTISGAGGVGANGSGSGGKGGSLVGATSTPGANGKKPGGGGGGNNTSGGGGRVIITYCTSPGSIETGHTLPNPAERTKDSVYNVVAGPGITNPDYYWEQSTNNSTWTVANASIQQSYPLINPNITSTTYYRRTAYTCASPYYTNSAYIKVVTKGSTFFNGSISGKVTSKNGAGVVGDTITVQKKIKLLGSPQSQTYTAVTGTGGNYSVTGIFYGDNSNGDPLWTVVTITAKNGNHGFTTKVLTDSLQATADGDHDGTATGGNNFTDTTVYSITGTVTQTCTGCVTGFTSAGEPGVKITTTNAFTNTAADGTYGITVTDPGTYTLTPTYLNHTFTPVTRTATIVNKDSAGLNFTDATTKTISGVFKAGCDQYIGTVKLTFTDTGAVTHFKKEVTTTANSGAYSITLPARTYKVSVSTFTKATNGNGNDIVANDLYTFFNTTIKDSLIRNIDSTNATLDLIYHRAPAIQTVNLADTSCQINGSGYVVFQQNIPRTFTVKLWEGDAAKACPIATDTNRIKLITSVQVDDVNETLFYNQTSGSATITLNPGSPNIVSPYLKYFNLTYTDKYKRAATPITRNVVVKGIKTDPGTFTTVSPQVPMLILHDPPGDNSFSFWESGKTTETAARFFTKTANSTNTWGEVKVGTSLSAGIGIEINTDIWGTIAGGLEVSAEHANTDEVVLSTTTSQYYSTADNSNITGDAGDVYIGAAMNLLYSVAHELKYTSPCTLGVEDQLIIADDGFATTYAYSEDHIVNNVIPTLEEFVASETDPVQKANYEDQISVWQQVIANNAANKAKAAFDQNISFDGTSGAQTSTTTTSSSNSSTIEFNLAIDQNTAIGLGLEINGVGASGTYTVACKMETGASSTNTVLNQTTTGYTIDDDDDGDYYTVDIKKDPVYNTPVFVLVAGTASCPPEPVAQKRDACQLLIPQPVQSGISADGEALFILNLSNTSESGESRTYDLSFVQASNPNGAIVTIGGSPVILPIPYTIGYLQTVQVTVSVKKSAASSVYSYEGLQFMLTDNCDGSVSKTNTISANFISPCSGITMAAPGNNWVIKAANNNSLPVQFNGYTLSNLQSVALEYSTAGNSSWVTAFTKYQNEITDPNSTTVDWDVSAIADGGYDIRLKLTCSNGTVYSTRVSGIIDRRAPSLLGNPEPTDDNYVAGDVISMSYTETIDNTNLNSNKVELRRLSNNTVIPVQVSGFENKLVVVPVASISGFAGDSMRLIVKDITDAYGNLKTTPDTSNFTVGVTVVGTGTKLVTLSTVKTSMLENASGTMDVLFTLPVPAVNDIQVNYTIAGGALYATDYTVTYFPTQPLSTSFNGIQGNIVIPKNSTQAILKIDPVGDALQEANENLIFTLSEGGDYVLGLVISVTDTIKNDDLTPPVITANRPVTFCTGDSVVLSTAAAYAYLWSTGATTQSITVKTSGSYTVTIFDALGSTGNSMPTVVTVNTKPTPVITGTPTICSGSPAVLDAGAYASYLWSNGVTTRTNSVTVKATYTVTVTDANGCSATSPSVTVQTSTNPTPVITVTGSTTNLCPGTVVNLNAGTGYKTYLWSTGAVTDTINVTTAGSYTVTVSNSRGCIGVSPAVAVSYQTCAKPTSPVVSNITATGAKFSWTAPSSCAVGYQLQYRKTGTSTWTTVTLTATNTTVTDLKKSTTYEWKVKTQCQLSPLVESGFVNGTNFTTPAAVAAFSSIEPGQNAIVAETLSASVYPNPAKNSALLTVNNKGKEITVTITDITGKAVWKSAPKNTSQVQLPVANLAGGIYIITVTNGISTSFLKFVKE